MLPDVIKWYHVTKLPCYQVTKYYQVTKLSNYHFVSHNAYKKRIIQLGEHPSRVYNFGALGVENIKKTKMF